MPKVSYLIFVNSVGRRKQRAEALSLVLVLSFRDLRAFTFYTEMFKGDIRNSLSHGEDDRAVDILIQLIKLAKLLFYKHDFTISEFSGPDCIEEMRSTLIRFLHEAKCVIALS